jgi:hypothetical protein
MSSQQPAHKAPLWKMPGFVHVLGGGSSLLAAAVLYFLISFPPLRQSNQSTTVTVGQSYNNLNTLLEVFFLLVIPLTFISIIFIGRGLNALTGTRRTVAIWMLSLALLMILLTATPLSLLFQSGNGIDFSWMSPFSYVISASLAVVGAALLVQSLIEFLKKRRAA